MNLHVIISLVGYLEPNTIRIEYRISKEDMSSIVNLPFTADNAVEIVNNLHAHVSKMLEDAKNITFLVKEQQDKDSLHISIPSEYFFCKNKEEQK